MSRTCWLHIGTHKTGTTAVQRAFHRYSSEKLFYLPGSHANHSVPMLVMFHPHPRMFYAQVREMFGACDPQELGERLRAKLRDTLMADRRDVLISAETLSNPDFAAGVPALIDFLRLHFDTIKVIAYLREPGAFTTSMLSEIYKKSGKPFAPNHTRLQYRRRLDPWLKALPASDVHVNLYPSKGDGRDVVSEIATLLDVSRPDVSKSTSNSSPSAESMAQTNRLLRGTSAEFVGKLQKKKSRFASEFPGRPFALAPDVLQNLLDQQKQDIAWAEALLDQKFPKYRPPENARFLRNDNDLKQLAEDTRPAFQRWLFWRMAWWMPGAILRKVLPRRRGSSL